MKNELHPRNRHKERYDFKLLIESLPRLAPYVIKTKYKEDSIDFSNPEAVKALNTAILKHFYGISWDIPSGYLCPPIPGRADYIHYIADLLSTVHNGVIPRGPSIRVLDIGVGANCIYPLIGHREYGWNFLGSDIDPTAAASARKIVQGNTLSEAIVIKLQTAPLHIFKGVLDNEEPIDISICNPPFHASPEEAKAGSQKKQRNLGLKSSKLNFGGKANELWCSGGELNFIIRMIQESKEVKKQCRLFSSLVSKAENLPSIYAELKKIKAQDIKTIEMAQGHKKSRLVAWTF